MKDERIDPKPSGTTVAPKPDIRERAANIIEVTRAKWRHDEVNQHPAAASAHRHHDVLRRQLPDNLDTMLAVAELMAHLFGYQRDGVAPEPDPVKLASPRQRLEALVRARSATLAGNDDFYGPAARRQRSPGVARHGARPWKR